MEKNMEENYNHTINIIERKTITLTGIKKINNFNKGCETLCPELSQLLTMDLMMRLFC